MKQVSAAWTDVVLVCRKCSKKLEGGFGVDEDQSLQKALRKALAASAEPTRGKKPRRRGAAVIAVDCLGICPKNAVMALNAARPERWVVVPKGATMRQVARELGLADASAARRDRTALP